MIYDFDIVQDRSGTMAEKYDFAEKKGKPLDATPLWVADMEFTTAQPIIEALKKRAEHGIFGYTETNEAYAEVIKAWWKTHYSFDIQSEWITKTPTVVYSLATAVCAFTEVGDAVLIQQPVYHPFKNVITANQRQPVSNDLRLINGRYYMDLEDFEEKIKRYHIKLFLLCNPHNPVGRSWTAFELQQMGEICRKYGVIVVSDEIHCDFTWSGNQHTVLLNADSALEDQCIICTSPSKTFNLAGLQIANNIIPNAELREKFLSVKERAGYDESNIMAITACMAAYSSGQEWYRQLKAYLEKNISFVSSFISHEMPGITLIHPEATYLLWMDFRALEMSDAEIERRMLYDAKIWLNNGSMFGPAGIGFQRINVACARPVLQDAMVRMRDAFCLRKP